MKMPGTSAWAALVALLLPSLPARALSVVTDVEPQPLHAQVRRLVDALAALGAPLPEATRRSLTEAAALPNATQSVTRVQAILDPLCLFGVDITPEMRVKVGTGDAPAELDEHGWRVFLVKVHNESGTTAALKAESPNARRVHGSPADDVANRWLDLAMADGLPLRPTLGGLPLEYRIIQLYSRDTGRREGRFGFNVGQGTQDLGFRNETDILFRCRPARLITLGVRDEKGEPTVGAFEIRDAQGRVYPSMAKRIAPDFSFHPQIYRGDGESLRLPHGRYTVDFYRGPESIPLRTNLVVDERTSNVNFQVTRWIDPSTLGWWSGDHHIHAAGCAHYTKPTEGVLPEDMFRHTLGEDVKVGCNLTWGPCFDYQKQFFCGLGDKLTRGDYRLHYDVEVSQFGSHQSGHLVLLQLTDQVYPGGDSSKHWPTLGLNTLRWAKRQGAITGPAHTGWGLQIPTADLPSATLPPFDGIGANEYIVDVTHQVPGPDGKPVPAVDFLSTVDTPYAWELNIWYHTLNAGYRTRISGETDFPCIYGERVGLGRSYVQLPRQHDYAAWCAGVQAGRNYVSDGRSHLLNFTATEATPDGRTIAMGVDGSELTLSRPGRVRLAARAAARLPEQPDDAIRRRRYDQQPYWHIERARIGDTRTVAVEVVFNGQPVGRQTLPADGSLQPVEFTVDVPRSGWLALRILPSSHTNPIWVSVDGRPVREKASLEWCRQAVDKCWGQKERTYVAAEKAAARAAYDHARQVYDQRLAEAK